MSYDEEQLYFLGVEFNDDWTVRSGPIRKLKGKMFTRIFPLAHLCNIIGLCYNDFIDCAMILNNLIIMMMMAMTLKESCVGGPPGCCVDVHENLASAQHRQTIRLTSTCIIITATITSSHHYNHYHIDISINITYISHIYHKGGRYLSFLIEWIFCWIEYS